ncbi:MAG: ligase-associated DNA damage response exonuclease [Fimbriimonadaceae bacterium]|nr:ligase-associated DNA damage response exonuclease [Fimbriimonadaceae bacterium]
MADLLRLTPDGLYCEAGDFHIDPWRAVERAIVTHAHGDHARRGSRRYLCSREGAGVLRLRLGPATNVTPVEYGEARTLRGVRVSLHPAGHILGSAQVRVEYGGEVWVVTGDYKTAPDPTVRSFEPVRCHTLVTECTFGSPLYRWPDAGAEFAKINAWWRANRSAGRASILMGYSLGKAQRLLGGVDPGIGPVFLHDAVATMTDAYREAGVVLPLATPVANAPLDTDWTRALVIAPPGVEGTSWMRRFRSFSTAFASGWMALRGARRRLEADMGFVISDHVDWPALLGAVRESGAERVRPTHGFTKLVARYLREQGLDAAPLETPFGSEEEGTG